MASKNQNTVNHLGSRISALRKEKGYSLTDLANAIGSSKTVLSRIENGLTEPTMKNLVRIADALEIQLYELLLPEGAADSTEVLKKYADENADRLNQIPIGKMEKVIDTIDSVIRLCSDSV